MDALADLERRFAALDERLLPIARQPVDIDDPDWLEKLHTMPSAVDQAGVRREAEALVSEVSERYRNGTEADRRAIRGLFARHGGVAWAAPAGGPATTPDGFRRHLLLLSMTAHTMDPRDAIVSLADLCDTARASGVETAPILRAVAALSSDEEIGMGTSVYRLLVGAC